MKIKKLEERVILLSTHTIRENSLPGFTVIEQKVSTVLRPTGINLAPYVVNPYQGCQMGCLFCYAQFSKMAQKEKMPWGGYVKVKINAGEILEEELEKIKPEKVLLGSTTECFQAVEKRYKITENILRILNRRKIDYVILTRSGLITDYLDMLSQGYCKAVYFTLDTLPSGLREKCQPHALSLKEGVEIVQALCKNKINTVAYFCPVMPWLFDCKDTLKSVPRLERAEFELINFKLAGMEKLLGFIREFYPGQAAGYVRLLKDKQFYQAAIRGLKGSIEKTAKKHFRIIKIHCHDFDDYFGNVY